MLSRAVISRLAGVGPTVLALEDLHWADPTSLLLTEELSSLTADGPLLLVFTHRPEPDPGVTALEEALGNVLVAKLRKVELGPLTQHAEGELARSLVGEGAGQDVLDSLRTGAEGNPLFLEERLYSMMETGPGARAGRVAPSRGG